MKTERETETSAEDAFGAQVAGVLRTAHEQAQSIRQDAEDRARAMLDDLHRVLAREQRAADAAYERTLRDAERVLDAQASAVAGVLRTLEEAAAELAELGRVLHEQRAELEELRRRARSGADVTIRRVGDVQSDG